MCWPSCPESPPAHTPCPPCAIASSRRSDTRAKAAKRKSDKNARSASTGSDSAHFTDTKTLRARARKNLDDGAITQTYTADRKEIIKRLNASLATEYVCVLRYYRHYFMASGMLADAVKGEFLEHAQQEQEHAAMIAERIVQLGGEPDLNPDTLTARPMPNTRKARTCATWSRKTLSPSASPSTATAN